MRKKVPVLIRLVRRVDRLYGDLPENAPELGICWPWLGARTTNGHGVIRDDAGQLAYTHRIALAASLGRPLRPGALACHRCDNKPCCRPSHLYEGTKSDNEEDKWYVMRVPRGDRIIGIDAALPAAVVVADA